MRETTSNPKTCQDPNFNEVSVLNVFVNESARTLTPPPLWEAIKHLNLVEAKQQYCSDPDHCGHSMLTKYDGTTIAIGGVQICRNHNCPVTQLVKAYHLLQVVGAWMQIYSIEVQDQCYAERRVRAEAKDLGIIGRRIPTDHGTAIFLTPAPLSGSMLYTGDTWDLYQMVIAVPEGKNITSLKPKSESGRKDGTNANGATALESGIPLKGKPAYGSTPLSTEELSVACGEAGFPLSFNQADQLQTPPAESVEQMLALSDLFERLKHPDDSYRLHLRLVLKQQSAGIGEAVDYPILIQAPKRARYGAKHRQ